MPGSNIADVYFRAHDGVELAFREIGEGRPVVLLHGYISTARVNWLTPGHAAKLAAGGFRVILPDLRGHGDSAKPHDPDAYPPDVLADDGFALLEHLELTDYDLAGYSLGGRTVVRMLARGARPGRAIVAGMGLSGITEVDPAERFRRVLANPGISRRGSADWRVDRFLRSVGGDPVALLRILDTGVGTAADDLARIEAPVLVVTGDEDAYHASAPALAASFAHGEAVTVAGDHMSAVANPELGAVMAEFLSRVTFRSF
ncbi:alpha/beta fold hydrolase [Amycolatopsis sp.]|uniref:alpha/beta fold hydrolase n=1 Tax=Amycolatopsis sp. TaxID=37632 RepID=UPI002C59B3A3|nr:alpha/beta fold hydrolase [Amycolatopsis sp.]HVV09813.1 alpha/beta fold hydrolase [Amycolatopsis sp.]